MCLCRATSSGCFAFATTLGLSPHLILHSIPFLCALAILGHRALMMGIVLFPFFNPCFRTSLAEGWAILAIFLDLHFPHCLALDTFFATSSSSLAVALPAFSPCHSHIFHFALGFHDSGHSRCPPQHLPPLSQRTNHSLFSCFHVTRQGFAHNAITTGTQIRLQYNPLRPGFSFIRSPQLCHFNLFTSIAMDAPPSFTSCTHVTLKSSHTMRLQRE